MKLQLYTLESWQYSYHITPKLQIVLSEKLQLTIFVWFEYLAWTQWYALVVSGLKFLKLIFDKIRKAIFISKEIFNTDLNFYSYKELSNIVKKNEKTIQDYITRNRKSKSVTGKYIINRLQNNDIKLYLCDYKKFANLNNSFWLELKRN